VAMTSSSRTLTVCGNSFVGKPKGKPKASHSEEKDYPTQGYPPLGRGDGKYINSPFWKKGTRG
jgi:hypothetical protein